MGLEFLGGIANAYRGFEQGRDRELDRQYIESERQRVAQDRVRADADREEDRSYLKQQRAQQSVNQAREVKRQAQDDELDNALSSIPTTKTLELEQAGPGPAQVGEDGVISEAPVLPMKLTLPNTQDERLRMAAKAYGKSRNFLKSFELENAADAIASKRSAQQFAQVDAGAKGKSTLEIANSIAEIFSNDPHAGKIEKVSPMQNGGVSINVLNQSTGERTVKTFNTAEEILEGMRSFYAPETQAKLLEQRIALGREQAKALSEREKFVWQESIKAGFRGAPGGRTGGAGGSAAPGKPERTGKEIALATVEDKFKSELDPSALTRVRNFVSTSYDLDPSIDNLQRVLAAEEAATSPASVTPRLMFGSQAGIAATHVNATTGAKTPLHKVSPQYTPTEDDLKGFKADVASYIDAENKRQDGFGNVLLAAAQGSQTAVAEATNMLAGKIAQDLIARKPFPPGMPVAEKQKALAALQERSMALAKQNMPLVKNSISMIKAYGLK